MEENLSPEKAEHSLGTLPDYPRVRFVLLALASLCFLGALLGLMLFQGIAALSGWDVSSLTTNDAAPAMNAWQLRLLLTLNHLTTFLLPAVVTVALFYGHFSRSFAGPYLSVRTHWRDYLLLRRFPDARLVGLAVLLILASLPMVLWLYQVNKALPIPDSLRLMEEQTEAALKALLVMDDAWAFLANLLLIALLPAVGEELVFRGILQRQLMRRIDRPWVAIVLTAAIFSAIHMQFEGFLSRWLLGIVLGWLYWRGGSLWLPVMAHFFNNGLQVVGQYLYKNDLSTVDLEQDINIPWPAAIVSLVFMVLLVRYFEKLTPTNQPSHP